MVCLFLPPSPLCTQYQKKKKEALLSLDRGSRAFFITNASFLKAAFRVHTGGNGKQWVVLHKIIFDFAEVEKGVCRDEGD